MPIDLEHEDWAFCGLCRALIVRCQACRNSSCNGGGCDKCMARFEAAIALSNRERDNWPSWYAALYERYDAETPHTTIGELFGWGTP